MEPRAAIAIRSSRFQRCRALQRIRKRADGACGFLSADNRCRIHEELGAAKKPLTCRLFPYAFHTAADGVVVTASFGCPTDRRE